MLYTPPATAIPLTIYGKTVKIFTVDDLGADNVADAIVGAYFENNKWVYLASKTFFTINGDVSTKEKTDAFIESFLEVINEAIQEKLAPKDDGVGPQYGIERIEFILGKLVVNNNKIEVE